MIMLVLFRVIIKMSVDLKSKLSNICLNYISLNHYDYFILTETWLTNDINSKELGMDNY